MFNKLSSAPVETKNASNDGSNPALTSTEEQSSYDPVALHPMAITDGNQLQYLDLETNTKRAEGLIASRGFLEDLSYGTGAMYMLGLGVGGFAGLVEGLRSTSSTMSARLRSNAILNSITRRGPYIGNLAGCLTLTYNFVNGGITAIRGGEDDDAGSLAAGAITGALWNSSRGLKPMLISSTLLAMTTAGWCRLKHYVAPEDDE
ncbi:protein transporter [Starmerella bacillaris]|uniref:Protein transporter n=1 Tax=Starmerella bacillaris TaxID=1247836 RepID=A0AAV5RMK0_STABA|nr:protein transporter [Starmerella bacillaris]